MEVYHSEAYDILFSVNVMLLFLSASVATLLRMILTRSLAGMYRAAEYLAIYPLINLTVNLFAVAGFLPGFFSGIQNSYYALLLITQSVDIWKLFVDFVKVRKRS